MQGRLRFALNHMVVPRASAEALFATAAELGFDAVEIRNDLPGTAIADGTSASVVRAGAEGHGVRILSINALQRFNDWTSARAEEAHALAEYAQACGTEALVLCPVNDARFRPGERARLDGLRRALSELRAILSGRGITGLVEPLGFAECSLRYKREAVEAIDAIGGGDTFRLLHDTFHHAIAGDPELFPERTGLTHVSGVEEKTLPLSATRDAHRVLVGPRDRLDNLGQIRSLVRGGYAGFFSFEPFAENVHVLADAKSALRQSAAYLANGLESEAA
jgi:2-keto-myo-inositol isomerase